MTDDQEILPQLLQPLLGAVRCQRLLARVAVPAALSGEGGTTASRGLIAQALNLLLLEDLMERVPLARAYVEESFRVGRPIQFDHWSCAAKVRGAQGRGDSIAATAAIGNNPCATVLHGAGRRSAVGGVSFAD